MAVEFRRPRLAQMLPEATVSRPAEVRKDLEWGAAITVFIECWAADHPGIRSSTLSHYREQLRSRLAAFAVERGIAIVQEFSRYDLRAFVAWLEDVVTYAGRPLAPRGKQMALDVAKRFLVWLYQEKLIAEDVTVHVGKYRLDKDLEPRATPVEDVEKLLSALNVYSPLGVRNAAMIQIMAFCGLRVAELVGLNANDLDLQGGRIRVRAETSKGRRSRFVDLPLTIVDGREVVRPEVAALMGSWLQARSSACPQLREDDALFVNLSEGRQPAWTARLAGESRTCGRPDPE